jgi:hypothetical protein
MKYVSMNWHAVAAFAARWPCFGPVRPLAFEFDDAGDLIDVRGDTANMDPAGVSALADNAKRLAGFTVQS